MIHRPGVNYQATNEMFSPPKLKPLEGDQVEDDVFYLDNQRNDENYSRNVRAVTYVALPIPRAAELFEPQDGDTHHKGTKKLVGVEPSWLFNEKRLQSTSTWMHSDRGAREATNSFATQRHFLNLAEHAGARRMYDTLRQHYFWPHRQQDVQAYVWPCESCRRHRLLDKQQQ